MTEKSRPCPSCNGRSDCRPTFDTCADCAPDDMTEAEAAREALNLIREAVMSGILDGETLNSLGASFALQKKVGAE